MKPIRTYAVTVKGYGEALYSARSPGKALARAWRSFQNVNDQLTFAGFMKIATARRVKDPPGCGERILLASGETVTRIYCPTQGHYVHYMKDDSDVALCAHPLDVAGAAA
jgi:hypothetical protein